MGLMGIDGDRPDGWYRFARKVADFLNAFKDSEEAYSALLNGLSLMDEINSETARLSSERDAVKRMYESEKAALEAELAGLSEAVKRARGSSEAELKVIAEEHAGKIEEYKAIADYEISRISANADE